ncbi:MAG: ferrous iron transport protein A [Clostridia bacterium]|nr:ferrous iron transport protein A [Clostridia bacterium]
MNRRCLSLLHPGESGRVVSLSCESGIKRRLQDLGLVAGTKVRCLQQSPLGDPTAFLICGAVIALRREDSENILIE